MESAKKDSRLPYPETLKHFTYTERLIPASDLDIPIPSALHFYAREASTVRGAISELHEALPEELPTREVFLPMSTQLHTPAVTQASWQKAGIQTWPQSRSVTTELSSPSTGDY